MSNRAIWILGAAALAGAVGLTGRALAQDRSAFAELGAADTPAAELRERLPEAARNLRGLDDVIAGGHIVYATPDDRNRRARAADFDAAVTRGAKALEDAGIARNGRPPQTFVIEIDVSGGFAGAIEDEETGTLLVRVADERGIPPHGGALPGLVARSDGPSLVRDVTDAAGRLRVELWRRAASAGTTESAGGIAATGLDAYETLADRLVRWTLAEHQPPAWLRVGLRSWVAARMKRERLPDPAHLCGGATTGLAQLVAAGGIAPEQSATHLGRLVEALVERDVPLLAAAERTVKAGAADDATLAKALGAPLDELTAHIFPEDSREEPCKDGLLTCTICKGTAVLNVTCIDCEGTRATGCNACGGVDRCPMPGCFQGTHYYWTALTEKPCAYCKGKGRHRCKPCRGKGRRPCESCERGVVTLPCPACRDGKIPCPRSGDRDLLARVCGESEDAACPWCAIEGRTRHCDSCNGSGYMGCKACFGSERRPCLACKGSGWELTTSRYTGAISAVPCTACEGEGASNCGLCKVGRRECECKGSGVRPATPDDCGLCEGANRIPSVSRTLASRRRRLAAPSRDQVAAFSGALESGVKFLLGSKRLGAFTTRAFRETASEAGELDNPSLFSNALCLWALSAAGRDSTDREMVRPCSELRAQVTELIQTGQRFAQTQEVALALRALVATGAQRDDPLVISLVELLENAQRKDGLWGRYLNLGDDGAPFPGLFAIESLWLAQRRGIEVNRGVFKNAFRSGSRLFGADGYRGDGNLITGTDVCSALALVIIAKAGSLGDDAGTYDYHSITAVERGLAWIDRYLSVRHQPMICNGALVKDRGEEGYAAYLFAIQRLGNLLNIQSLAGERWYTAGARHLVSTQFPDGSWEETSERRLNPSVRSTAITVLFLTRATPAVTETGD